MNKKMRKFLEQIIDKLKAKGLDYEGEITPEGVRDFLTENHVDEITVKGKTSKVADLFQTKTVVVQHLADGNDALVIDAGEGSADGTLSMDEEDEKKADDSDEDDDGEKSAKRRSRKQVTDHRASRAMRAASGGASNAAHKSYNNRVKRTEGMGLKRSHRQSAVFSSAEQAEAFGAYARLKMLAMFPNDIYRKRQGDTEIVEHYFGSKAQLEGDNALGGALVPDEFLPELIDLREEFGIFRRLTTVYTMRSETLIVPRLTDDVSISYPGENTAATETNAEFDNVQLTLRKAIALTLISSELLEDSALNASDVIARSMTKAIERHVDEAAWAGDGTSTYGGMWGIINKLLGVDGTITNVAGIVQGGTSTDTDWTTFDYDDFTALMGALPAFAEDNASWHTSKPFYEGVMKPIQTQLGGTSFQDAEGTRVRSFMGFPVEIINSSTAFPMTAAPGTDTCVATFGDLSMAAKYGEKRGMEIASSTDRYFDQDAVALRMRQRHHVNVHDVGDTSTAGPVVGLFTSSS